MTKIIFNIYLVVMSFVALVLLAAIILVTDFQKQDNDILVATPTPTIKPIKITPTIKPRPTKVIKPTSTAAPTSIPSKTPVPVPTNTVTPTEIYKINTSQKIVVLTFDGGSGSQSAQKILNVMDNKKITTTFFVTGKWAEQNPDFIKSMHNKGHEIFNHTYSHSNLTTVSDAQIREEFKSTNRIVRELTGVSTKPYFRPPYGSRNQHVLDIAWQEGYQSIYWTIDALDWKEPEITEEEVKARIFDNLAPGNIYLLHIGDNITGNILKDVINELNARGYQVMSLTQALSL